MCGQNSSCLLLFLMVVLVSGCSHNISTYSDGIGLETTFRPDSGNFGIVLRYGKIWSFVARENSEAEMNGINEFDAKGEPLSSTTGGNVSIRIGAQTTGYDRDIIVALKDHPEAIRAFYEAKGRISTGAAEVSPVAETE